MFAIAFDLVVADTIRHHPSHNPSQAYADIRTVLTELGFKWQQGSLYTTEDTDMARLFSAISALRALPWFPLSVRDIRAFRVENWSDFTHMVRSPTP